MEPAENPAEEPAEKPAENKPTVPKISNLPKVTFVYNGLLILKTGHIAIMKKKILNDWVRVIIVDEFEEDGETDYEATRTQDYDLKTLHKGCNGGLLSDAKERDINTLPPKMKKVLTQETDYVEHIETNKAMYVLGDEELGRGIKRN